MFDVRLVGDTCADENGMVMSKMRITRYFQRVSLTVRLCDALMYLLRGTVRANTRFARPAVKFAARFCLGSSQALKGGEGRHDTPVLDWLVVRVGMFAFPASVGAT